MRPPSPEQVIDRVAEWYGLPSEALVGPCRERHVVKARETACAVLIGLCGLSARRSTELLGRAYTGRSTDLASRAKRMARAEWGDVAEFTLKARPKAVREVVLETVPEMQVVSAGVSSQNPPGNGSGYPASESDICLLKTVTDTSSKNEDVKRTPPTPPRGTREIPAPFVAFWDAYPRKIEKTKALRCWRRLVEVERVPADTLLAASQHYARWCQDTGTLVKYPATFLGPDRHWEEFLAPRPVTERPTRRPPDPLEMQSQAFYSNLRWRTGG